MERLACYCHLRQVGSKGLLAMAYVCFLMLSVVSFREFMLPGPFGMLKGHGGPGASWPWPLMLEGTTVETSVVVGFDVGEGLQGKDAMRWISR